MPDRPGVPLPDQGRPLREPVPPVQRDWVIDLARIAALAVVVLLHWLYLRVTVVDGVMQTELALSGPVFWTLSWLLMVMPVFFLAGGYANTMVWDRRRSAGQSGAAFVADRTRRLLSPVLFLVLVTFGVISLVSAIDPGAAARLTDRAGLHLWFVAAFLICVALTPVAVRSHDTQGAWVLPVILTTGSLGVDLARYSGVLDYELARWPSLLLVWWCCHQWGVLYARGFFARVSTGALIGLVAGCAAVLSLMVAWGPYPVANVGMADVVGTNLMPPTTVMTVLGFAQACLLAMVARRVGGRSPGRQVVALIAWANPRSMVIYLWHVPALAAVTFLGLLAPGVLMPSDPGLWWALRPLWIGLSLIVLWAALQAAIAWELQWQAFPTRGLGSAAASVAAVLGALGVAVLWRAGIGPAAAPLLGIILVVAALALVTRAGRGAVATSVRTPIR